jgi:hypothetical protein
VALLKIHVFWDVTPCCLIYSCRRFERSSFIFKAIQSQKSRRPGSCCTCVRYGEFVWRKSNAPQGVMVLCVLGPDPGGRDVTLAVSEPVYQLEIEMNFR